MKELWLYGRLDTYGKTTAQEQTEDDAKAVQQMINVLLGGQSTTKQDQDRTDMDDTWA